MSNSKTQQHTVIREESLITPHCHHLIHTESLITPHSPRKSAERVTDYTAPLSSPNEKLYTNAQDHTDADNRLIKLSNSKDDHVTPG